MTFPNRNDDPTGWAYALLATEYPVALFNKVKVPRWTQHKRVGQADTWALATSVLWLARRGLDHADEETLLVAMVDAAITAGRHATQYNDEQVAAYCGMPLVAGHVLSEAQARLADPDPMLGPIVRDLINAMWPKPGQPAGPCQETIHPALALHRTLRTWGDGKIPCLENLAHLGLAQEETYEPRLRTLLYRIILSPRFARDEVLAEPLREAFTWYVTEHAKMATSG
ncbi:hypothetical protein ACGFJC_47290 [Nonomuraea fuscirosea]|uniref:hypothetical protein n=1 Tax=Nonomuraea fuscirosea TaxID=1291556 RepID=UPI00371C8D73